jgi:hypothetical protein
VDRALKRSQVGLLGAAVDKDGNAAAAVRKELKTTVPDKPLRPDDFPVRATGNEIVAQDGAAAAAEDPRKGVGLWSFRGACTLGQFDRGGDRDLL